MYSLITILKKIKYHFTFLISSEKEIPSKFNLFERRTTSYDKFLNSHCRNTLGEKINLDKELKIFGKQGKPCEKCSNKIKKIKVAGRGTHVCNKCQKTHKS